MHATLVVLAGAAASVRQVGRRGGEPISDRPHPTMPASRMGPPGKGRQHDTKCHKMFALENDAQRLDLGPQHLKKGAAPRREALRAARTNANDQCEVKKVGSNP